MIYETFREAVKNIWSNKFRTVLTMLGIIIGVTAVIVIVGLGNGMTQSIKDSFSEMGTNVLSVQITGRGSRTVTVQQMYDIVDSQGASASATVCPTASASPNACVTGRMSVATAGSPTQPRPREARVIPSWQADR